MASVHAVGCEGLFFLNDRVQTGSLIAALQSVFTDSRAAPCLQYQFDLWHHVIGDREVSTGIINL